MIHQEVSRLREALEKLACVADACGATYEDTPGEVQEAVNAAFRALAAPRLLDALETPAVGEVGEIIERLRKSAVAVAQIKREMAEAKSLRQGDHDPPRADLYHWPTPEQTTEWQAADLLERLTRQPEEGEVERAFRDGFREARYMLEPTIARDIPTPEEGSAWAYRRAALSRPQSSQAVDREWAGIAMMAALHSNVPEEKRPMSRSDFSDEQWARVQEAVDAVLGLAILHQPPPIDREEVLRVLEPCKRMADLADFYVEAACPELTWPQTERRVSEGPLSQTIDADFFRDARELYDTLSKGEGE